MTDADAAATAATAVQLSSLEPPLPAAPASSSPAAAAAGIIPASPASPAAPPTPLEQRQWQRAAQRSMRLAVTAFKTAKARVAEANGQGTESATQLTNSLLTAGYVPSMELPAVLKQVPGLQPAAIAKLQSRQQQQLQQLRQALAAFEAAVQHMAAALADVRTHAAPSSSSGTSSSDGSSWQDALPVFHTLSLQASADLLHQVLEMHQKELQLKRDLLGSYEGAVAASQTGAGSSSSSSKGSMNGSTGMESLRAQLTVAITTWMVRPFVDDEIVEQLMRVLSDEMVGF